MNLKLVINDGTPEDVVLMKNLLNSYDVGVEILSSIPKKNEMGGEFLATLLIIAPSAIQTLEMIMPAVVAYINIKKPTGTKNSFEVVNGKKKIAITNEDGKAINIDEIIKFCNKTDFFG